MNQIKKIIEYSALLYALLIFLGYSFIDTYYDNFDISIFSYLDASEILLSFLRNINYLVFMIVILIGINVTKFFPTKREEYKGEVKYENLTFIKKTKIHLPYIIGILIGIYFLIDSILMSPFDAIVVAVYISLLILFYFIYKQLPMDFSEFNFIVNVQLQRITFLLLAIFALNYLSSYVSYRRIKDKITITKFSFSYNNQKYNSSDTLFYIGATSKYIFLKNFNNGVSFVIEKDKISDLRIKKYDKSKNIN